MWYTSGYKVVDPQIQTKEVVIHSLDKTEISTSLQEKTKVGLVICVSEEIQDSTGDCKPGELQK